MARGSQARTWRCCRRPRPRTTHFPLLEISGLGYEAAVHGQKTYNGVAILSRHPIEDLRRGLPGDTSDEQARYIEATVKGLRVAEHLPAERQPVGQRQVRLQARLDGAAAHAYPPHPAANRDSAGTGRRLQLLSDHTGFGRRRGAPDMHGRHFPSRRALTNSLLTVPLAGDAGHRKPLTMALDGAPVVFRLVAGRLAARILDRMAPTDDN